MFKLTIMVDDNETLAVITRNQNKIRFWSDFDTISCKKLLDHIIDIENEYDLLYSSLNLSADDISYDKIPTIELYINSPGGTLSDAFAVIDHIMTSNYKFISIIEGSVASAGTLLSVICDERKIYENGMMLIHELSYGTYGRMSYISDSINSCDKYMKIIKKIYLENTKISKETLNDILLREIYWTAKESLHLGLVDEIIKSKTKKRFDNKISVPKKMLKLGVIKLNKKKKKHL